MIRPKQINKWSKWRKELLEKKIYVMFSKKSVIFGKITILLKKKIVKKFIFLGDF